MNEVTSNYFTFADRHAIPHHMIGGLYRYIEHRIPPGDFLMVVLSNDLKEACGRADDTNIKIIPNYVRFLYNDAPSQCWGSPEKVRAWLTSSDGANDAK